MALKTYLDRTPVGGPAYCDASFLLDLFANRYPPPGLPAHKKLRAHQASQFFAWARAQEMTFFTSMLALQECYQVLLFAEVKKHGSGDWKAFRSKDPAKFSSYLNRGRLAVRAFHAFLSLNAIETLEHGAPPFTSVQSMEPMVCLYARYVIWRFAVDVNDAFHFVFTRRFGIPTSVSSDKDWQLLPYHVVVCPP